MQLNHIVKSLLITGLFTTSSLPLLAAEAPKDATAATQQANNLLYNQLPFADILSDVFLVSHWIGAIIFPLIPIMLRNSETAVISLFFSFVLIFQGI